MTGARWFWPATQAVIGALMVSTIFYAVTGFLWWLGLNVIAGLTGVAAAALWKNHELSRRLSFYAAGVFVPLNLFFGVMNMVLGGPYDAVPIALIAISVAQAAVTFGIWHSMPQTMPEADAA